MPDDDVGTRQGRERDFWGHQLPSLEQARAFVEGGPDPNTAAAFDALEPLEDVRVLDLACGVGIASLWLARRGAQVVGVDITPRCIEVAEELSRIAGIEGARFEVCGLSDLHHLEPFDRLFGRFALHHLDIAEAGAALGAVLGEGPSAFIETMAMNPVLRFARRHLVGRWGIPRYGTLDEHPLTAEDLALLSSELGSVRTFAAHPTFARILDRQILHHRWPALSRLLGTLDDSLLGRPRWQHWSYHQVVVFEGDRGSRPSAGQGSFTTEPRAS